MPGKIVSQEEWVVVRKELLAKEKELTRSADELSAQIREMPMVKLGKLYTFDGPTGKVELKDLFHGRQQLIIYHFMFDPDAAEGCNSCSFFADHIPDLRHLESRNTSFAAISRAPIAKIEAFKKRMGWTFPWYSSFGTSFNYDFHVTMDESVAPIEYNFKDKATLEKQGMPWFTKGEQPGMSAFYYDGKDVFHTYSAYSRGLDKFLGTHFMLDLTHLGRGDTGAPGVGFKHHDRYDDL